MAQGLLARFRSCRFVEQQQQAARAHIERQRAKFANASEVVMSVSKERRRSRRSHAHG